MTFTGYQDMKTDSQKPPLPLMLKYLDDAADRLDLQIGWAELKKAREIQRRADDLRAAFAERVGAGRGLAADLARGYAAGKRSADDVIEQAASSATLAGEVGREARQLVEHAATAVQAEGAPLLHGVTEDRWLKLLVPVVTERLDAANAVADEIGIDAPRPARSGARIAAHPMAPTNAELQQDMALRHRWERLGAALQALDDVYAVADTLRRWRLLPIVDGRDLRESYRWLRVDRLDGSPDPTRIREWFLSNRHHGEPGLFTGAEMHDAAPLRSPADAKVGRRGRRVVA